MTSICLYKYIKFTKLSLSLHLLLFHTRFYFKCMMLDLVKLFSHVRVFHQVNDFKVSLCDTSMFIFNFFKKTILLVCTFTYNTGMILRLVL